MEQDQNTEEQAVDQDQGASTVEATPKIYSLDHEQFTVIAYNPRIQSIPFAIRYAHVREDGEFTDHIAGWYYGALGKKQYFESYFVLRLDNTGRLQNFFDTNGQHIKEGFFMDRIDINSPYLKKPMIPNPELIANMEQLAGKFMEDWFAFSEYLERGNLQTFDHPRVNKNMMEMMSREGDVLVYWSPNDPDPDTLGEMSLYWPLKTRFRSM